MILAEGAAEASADTFTGLMDHMGQGFEALGAAILVVGFYLVLRARSGGCAAIRLVAQGLAGAAPGIRRDLLLRAGSPGRRRPGVRQPGRQGGCPYGARTTDLCAAIDRPLAALDPTPGSACYPRERR